MSSFKPVEFRGTSLVDLRCFPPDARREAGHQIDRLQHGHMPSDCRPIATIGHGVSEIRIREMSGAFRIIYVATFADALYILHCFQKKTQQTRKTDLSLARRRYQELRRELQI